MREGLIAAQSNRENRQFKECPQSSWQTLRARIGEIELLVQELQTAIDHWLRQCVAESSEGVLAVGVLAVVSWQ